MFTYASELMGESKFTVINPQKEVKPDMTTIIKRNLTTARHAKRNQLRMEAKRAENKLISIEAGGRIVIDPRHGQIKSELWRVRKNH